MNSITDLLDLEDNDVTITDITVEGSTKLITLETSAKQSFCPLCGFRMHSRGIRTRKVLHPILQDGYSIILLLKQRRWKCINNDCRFETNENFKFVDKNRRQSNATDMLIVHAFRDLNETSASIAKRFNTSDTHVNEIFDRYVKLDRLELTDIISIDEVHTEIESDCKYALVIQDFHTGDPIDILKSRKSSITEPYFSNIPIEERKRVKYLISDMYNPYIRFVDKYFHNAVSVVDSFHVIQWMNNGIDKYFRQLLKKYRDRDRERFLSSLQSYTVIPDRIYPPLSDEVYLLSKYRFLVLSNQANITYHSDTRYDKHFHRLMNTYDYEDALFKIDPHLRSLRDLKELYIQFNTHYAGDILNAGTELDKLIKLYGSCEEKIFRDFSHTLKNFRDPVLNSFVMAQKNGPCGLYDSRLSNGPIESLNRKVKDLKRAGRGYKNFEHFRNRFLYATRNRPVLNGTDSSIQVHNYEDDDEYID